MSNDWRPPSIALATPHRKCDLACDHPRARTTSRARHRRWKRPVKKRPDLNPGAAPKRMGRQPGGQLIEIGTCGKKCPRSHNVRKNRPRSGVPASGKGAFDSTGSLGVPALERKDPSPALPDGRATAVPARSPRLPQEAIRSYRGQRPKSAGLSVAKRPRTDGRILPKGRLGVLTSPMVPKTPIGRWPLGQTQSDQGRPGMVPNGNAIAFA